MRQLNNSEANSKHERLRYQKNSISFVFMMIGIVFLVFPLFQVINIFKRTGISVPSAYNIDATILLGIKILVAVVAILLAFLCGEKFKTYSRKWTFVGWGLTAYSLLEIIYPLTMLPAINKAIELVDEAIKHDPSLLPIKFNETQWLVLVIGSLVIAAVFFAFATMIATKKTKQLDEYNRELKLYGNPE